MIDISSVLPLISFIIGLIAIYGFYNQRRQTAMDQGKKQADILQLRKDIDHAFDKIQVLEKSGACTDKDLAELRTDMKHVLTALERIERKLESKE
jgi:hypothetical protein